MRRRGMPCGPWGHLDHSLRPLRRPNTASLCIFARRLPPASRGDAAIMQDACHYSQLGCTSDLFNQQRAVVDRPQWTIAVSSPTTTSKTRAYVSSSALRLQFEASRGATGSSAACAHQRCGKREQGMPGARPRRRERARDSRTTDGVLLAPPGRAAIVHAPVPIRYGEVAGLLAFSQELARAEHDSCGAVQPAERGKRPPKSTAGRLDAPTPCGWTCGRPVDERPLSGDNLCRAVDIMLMMKFPRSNCWKPLAHKGNPH
jgi:hypothetical protein